MIAAETAEAGVSWREGVFWEWRGMPVRYAAINIQGKGAPLLLVHGVWMCACVGECMRVCVRVHVYVYVLR